MVCPLIAVVYQDSTEMASLLLDRSQYYGSQVICEFQASRSPLRPKVDHWGGHEDPSVGCMVATWAC